MVNKPPEVTMENVEAKPLRSPNFLNLKPKNASLALYWGNRSVGEKESSLRYNQLLAMGFVPAKPEEITDQFGNPCPEALTRDGRVLCGDLILLKISKADYYGALKYNAQSAAMRVRKFGVAMDGGRAEHQATESREIPKSALSGLPKKVSAYVPPLAGIDEGTNLAEK
jgi:hypothetical protein